MIDLGNAIIDPMSVETMLANASETPGLVNVKIYLSQGSVLVLAMPEDKYPVFKKAVTVYRAKYLNDLGAVETLTLADIQPKKTQTTVSKITDSVIKFPKSGK